MRSTKLTNGSTRKTFAIAIALALCVAMAVPAFAATSTDLHTEFWNYGSSYDGTGNGSYSPYKGEVVERMVSGEGVPRSTFSFDAYFTFNQTIVNKLDDHLTNGRYFTMDIANTDDNNKTMDAVYVYTTLPNPKVEVEDDPFPFGNGFSDEAEAVARDLVDANTEYNMFAHFEDYRNVTAEESTVEVNSAISTKSWTGEYNTEYWNNLVTFAIGSEYEGQ